MEWRKIHISKDQAAKGLSTTILNEFDVVNKAAGAPRDSAIFGTSRGRSGPHEDNSAFITIYLSPRAATVAPELVAKYKAVECVAPPIGVSLLVGYQASALRLLRQQ